MDRKRYVIAAGVAGVALVGATAMAATLGGLASENLGAQSSVVASCDGDGVTTAFTVAYDAADARDEVTVVSVGGVHVDCAGQTLTVTLTDSSNAVRDTASMTAVSGTNAVSTGTPPAAVLVENVHIVITG